MSFVVYTHTLNIYLIKVLLIKKNFLLVDEEKTPEQIMQEKQIEVYVIF
jgi:hypothetical protein